MAKGSKKNSNLQNAVQDFVAVAFAEDLEQAQDYKTLLQNNEIPAMIKQQNIEGSNLRSFAVMVPEDFLDEAHVLIESQDAYDDFYDLASDEQEEDFDDFDSFLDDDHF